MTDTKHGGTIELHVRNYKKAQRLDIVLVPGVNGIAGENAAGKSSGGVDAMSNLLGGKKLSPRDPVHDGADSYKLQATLHDLGLLLTRTGELQEDGSVKEEFIVTNSDGPDKGEVKKRPQELLDALMNGRSAELQSLMEMSKTERTALLFDIAKLDFTELDADRETAFAARKQAKQNAHALLARIDAMPVHAALPDKLVSVSDLMAELETVTEGNRSNAETQDKLEDVRQTHQAAVEAQRIILDQIKELQASALTQQGLVDRLVADEAILSAAVSALVDTDDTDIRERINNADDTNEQIRQSNARNALVEEFDIENGEAVKQDGLIKAIDKSKKDQLASADFPGGLSFVDTEVFLNGKQIEQASTVEQINATLDVAIARNPEFLLFAIRDGSLYDTKHRKTLDVAARERNVIVIFEIVADSLEDAEKAEAAVYMRDGVGTPIHYEQTPDQQEETA